MSSWLQNDSIRYSSTSEILNNFENNTLIVLALAGVLVGFAASFENKNYRRISTVVGLIVLFLAIIYFLTAFCTLMSLSSQEAGIIGVNEF
ncbi:MAG: hypothetical protein ACTSQI_17225 [Candidatus Helarchaeota archaeon]